MRHTYPANVRSIQSSWQRGARWRHLLRYLVICIVVAALTLGITLKTAIARPGSAAQLASAVGGPLLDGDPGAQGAPDPASAPTVTPTVPLSSDQQTADYEGSAPEHAPFDDPGLSSESNTATDLPEGLDGPEDPAALVPTPAAEDIIDGDVRWTKAESPISVARNTFVPSGSTLTIEPGVEVRFSPDTRILVDGTLRAEGTAEEPVRLVGTEGTWDSVVGTASSTIVLQHTRIEGAGSNGSTIASTGGTLTISDSTLTDSSGGITAVNSALTLSNTEVTGNTLDHAPLRVQLPTTGTTSIVGNRIGNNSVPPDTPQVFLSGGSITNTLQLEQNVFAGDEGPAVVLSTDTPLQGTIACNTFKDGSVGLQIRTNLPDITGFALEISDNAFIEQRNYGVTGTLPFDVTNNWWNDRSGPFAAARNPHGRGVASGVNVQFQPWLTERPACTPDE